MAITSEQRRGIFERGLALERVMAEPLKALRGAPGTTQPEDRDVQISTVRAVLDTAIECFDRARRDHDGTVFADPKAHLHYASSLIERASFDVLTQRLGNLVVRPARASVIVNSSLLDALNEARDAANLATEVAAEAVGVNALPSDQLAEISNDVLLRATVEQVLISGAIAASAIAAFSDQVDAPLRAGVLASFGVDNGAALRETLGGVKARGWINAWCNWFSESVAGAVHDPDVKEQLGATQAWVAGVASTTLYEREKT